MRPSPGLALLALPVLLAAEPPAAREPDLGWRAVASGRFDADAAADLVWRHEATGELRVWLMNGAAKAAESRLSPEAVPDPNWRLVGAADADGDGKTDLYWRQQLSGRNVVWRMGGLIRVSGDFTAPSTLADTNWYVGAVADLGTSPADATPDGRPDLVWRHAVSGRNVVWFMNGLVRTGGAYTSPDALVDANWRVVGAGDYGSPGSDAADGYSDLVWQHALSGRVVVWRMLGLARVQGLYTTPDAEGEAAWRISAAGDLTGDGRADLLWRHAGSGALRVWAMNGATRLAALDVPEPPAGPRGFPAPAPWVSFYGESSQMGSLQAVADRFRVINLDADPGVGNFTPQELATLRAGGRNRVISYLNAGACEQWRDYWTSVPAGFVSCGANTAAQIGPYYGYPDETWMNPANAAYRQLIVGFVAPRLAAQGVDGFFLDNLELVEHGTQTSNGPCDAACSQGGLDLVWELRQAFPDKLIVMQNATSAVTRLGSTHGLAYASLLDGISHEEVFEPADPQAQAELAAWRALALKPGGRPFWIATEDYVGSCANTAAAQAAYAQSRLSGFSPYATDESAGQQVVCFWPF